jgi:hypothetical protein
LRSVAEIVRAGVSVVAFDAGPGEGGGVGITLPASVLRLKAAVGDAGPLDEAEADAGEVLAGVIAAAGIQRTIEAVVAVDIVGAHAVDAGLRAGIDALTLRITGARYRAVRGWLADKAL